MSAPWSIENPTKLTAIKRLIGGIGDLNSKLILLVSERGKTRLLRELDDDLDQSVAIWQQTLVAENLKDPFKHDAWGAGKNLGQGLRDQAGAAVRRLAGHSEGLAQAFRYLLERVLHGQRPHQAGFCDRANP